MILFKTTMNYFLNPLSAKKVGKTQIQRGLGTAAVSNALFNLMKMESIRIRIRIRILTFHELILAHPPIDLELSFLYRLPSTSAENLKTAPDLFEKRATFF